jgi:hypothetical protein
MRWISSISPACGLTTSTASSAPNRRLSIGNFVPNSATRASPRAHMFCRHLKHVEQRQVDLRLELSLADMRRHGRDGGEGCASGLQFPHEAREVVREPLDATGLNVGKRG